MQESKLTEGPLGFPLTDRQAIALDTILKALPKDDAFRYRKAIIAKGPSEVLPGERSDVSWISTEDPDRVGDVVVAKGMNDSQFKLNPVVTLEHNYKLPPIGRSLWRKVVKVAGGSRTDCQSVPLVHGVKAKTVYPAKPAEWPDGKEWPPDIAFALLQAGLLQGKSIGLLPTKVHDPSQSEIDRYQSSDGSPNRVTCIIDEWLLVEYACTALPIQQNALVEAVSKSQLQIPDEFLEILGWKGWARQGDTETRRQGEPESEKGAEAGSDFSLSPCLPVSLSRFTPLEEIEKAFSRQIATLDIKHFADRAAREALDRLRGRV